MRLFFANRDSRLRRSSFEPAFTLVELSLVVIILGILAALVIPQFTDATADAKLNAMTSDLLMVRKQIAVYKTQHDGQYPSIGNFPSQMTQKTNKDGTLVGTPNLGPYLQTIPKNPFTDRNDVGTGPVGSSSWYYDDAEGEFRANCHASHTTY